jgi:DNA uptake protein ComE-like DNA-binding protein
VFKNSLRYRLQNDPYYRLQSAAEIAIAVELGIFIDANQATIDDWLRLPGISIHQARLLVQLSQSGVQFLSIEDVAAALNINVQRLKPLAPLLRFYYYDQESVFTPAKINPNTAEIGELLQIPEVDLQLAEIMIKNKEELGPYRNILDLQKRLSIPGNIIAKIMHYLKF